MALLACRATLPTAGATSPVAVIGCGTHPLSRVPFHRGISGQGAPRYSRRGTADRTGGSVAVGALLYAVAGLLVVAGLFKIVRPEDSQEALRRTGLPSRRGAARALGTFEVVLGAGAVLAGGELLASAVALLYVAFAVFVAVQRRRSAGAACGCLGGASPASPLHVTVNVGAAGVAAAAAVAGAPGLPGALVGAGAPTSALTVIALAVVVAALRMVLTTLPALAEALALHLEEAR